MLLFVDLDGTLANCSHRVPLIPDWDAFHERMVDDEPYQPLSRLLGAIALRQWATAPREGTKIGLFFQTGRPEKWRVKTQRWLAEVCDLIAEDDYKLMMRPDGDFSPDVECKWAMFERAIGAGGHVHDFVRAEGWHDPGESPGFMDWLKANSLFIEDRDRVVAMWRGKGFMCLQPQEGEY